MENTECKVIRGHNIKILGGCKIEYTGKLNIANNSIVGEKVCLKN
ncbi:MULTISPECIES: hypothetical protein [unclassified Clostridium]|nr:MULTISPECIES: hypothetical protein [unclassified Clostridium]